MTLDKLEFCVSMTCGRNRGPEAGVKTSTRCIPSQRRGPDTALLRPRGALMSCLAAHNCPKLQHYFASMSTCLVYVASLSPKELGILDNPQRLLQHQ